MTTVDPDRFRLANAYKLLEDKLEFVNATSGNHELLTRFAIESGAWLNEIDTSPADSVLTLSRAWNSLTAETLDFLEFVLFAPEKSWDAWRTKLDRATNEFSDGTRRRLGRRLIRAFRRLASAADYSLDLPSTPAAWRSLSVMKTSSPRRFEQIRSLTAQFRSAVVDGRERSNGGDRDGTLVNDVPSTFLSEVAVTRRAAHNDLLITRKRADGKEEITVVDLDGSRLQRLYRPPNPNGLIPSVRNSGVQLGYEILRDGREGHGKTVGKSVDNLFVVARDEVPGWPIQVVQGGHVTLRSDRRKSSD